MPEELNRVVTDRISNLLFLPSRDASENLAAEGIPADRIHFVGNVMIDSVCWALPQALALDGPARYDVAGRPSAVGTPPRPGKRAHPMGRREFAGAHGPQ